MFDYDEEEHIVIELPTIDRIFLCLFAAALVGIFLLELWTIL